MCGRMPRGKMNLAGGSMPTPIACSMAKTTARVVLPQQAVLRRRAVRMEQTEMTTVAAVVVAEVVAAVGHGMGTRQNAQPNHGQSGGLRMNLRWQIHLRASREALAEMRQPRGAMQTLNHAAAAAVAAAVAVPVMRAVSRGLSGRHGHLQRNRLSLGVVRRRAVHAAGMIVVLVMLMDVAAGKPFPE